MNRHACYVCIIMYHQFSTAGHHVGQIGWGPNFRSLCSVFVYKQQHCKENETDSRRNYGFCFLSRLLRHPLDEKHIHPIFLIRHHKDIYFTY